jgi:NAD(P)-dependent dehydrogenase (short-subunit alcohol dehydrogenase family)
LSKVESPVGGVAITGGGSGIGRQAALVMARTGSEVIVGDRDSEALARLRSDAEAEHLCIRTSELELRSENSVREFVQKAAAQANGLAGLVCSGGVSPAAPLLEMTKDRWDLVLDVNLTGTFIAAQEAARIMVGQGTGGSIVTVSSTMGASGGRPGFAHYAASKAGVIGLTKTLAIELGANGIRVNCVAPGAVDTPLFRETVGEAVAKTWSKSPLGRVGEPQDIAEAIEFLLTQRSSWITGQVIHVNGGVYM